MPIRFEVATAIIVGAYGQNIFFLHFLLDIKSGVGLNSFFLGIIGNIKLVLFVRLWRLYITDQILLVIYLFTEFLKL